MQPIEPHLLPATGEPDAPGNAGAAGDAAPGFPGRAAFARYATGAAVIAVSITLPDFAVDAMGSPHMRIAVREPAPPPQLPIWNPGAAAPIPVYATIRSTDRAAQGPVARATAEASDLPVAEHRPLGFLASGSERFELAFAGIGAPRVPSPTVSLGLPQAPAPIVQPTPAIRTRVIAVEQISAARRARPELTAGSAVERSIEVARQSVETAFAGSIDLSGDLRTALAPSPVRGPNVPNVSEVAEAPIAETPTRPAVRPANPSLPDAVRTQAGERAQAIPVPSNATDTAPGLAEPLQAVAKTHLDARINGVVTGQVEFEQMKSGIAIRLGSVIDLLQNCFSAEELAQLRAGGSVNAFIPLAQMQAAGIPIDYDPVYDEVAFGIDYDDAPQAGKVQVEQIGAPTLGADRALIDQIPR